MTGQSLRQPNTRTGSRYMTRLRLLVTSSRRNGKEGGSPRRRSRTDTHPPGKEVDRASKHGHTTISGHLWQLLVLWLVRSYWG